MLIDAHAHLNGYDLLDAGALDAALAEIRKTSEEAVAAAVRTNFLDLTGGDPRLSGVRAIISAEQPMS